MFFWSVGFVLFLRLRAQASMSICSLFDPLLPKQFRKMPFLPQDWNINGRSPSKFVKGFSSLDVILYSPFSRVSLVLVHKKPGMTTVLESLMTSRLCRVWGSASPARTRRVPSFVAMFDLAAMKVPEKLEEPLEQEPDVFFPEEERMICCFEEKLDVLQCCSVVWGGGVFLLISHRCGGFEGVRQTWFAL